MTIIIQSKKLPEWQTVINDVQKASFRVINAEISIVDIVTESGSNIAKEYDPTEYEVKCYDNT